LSGIGVSDTMQMLPTSCPTSPHISGGRDKNETELTRALFSGMVFYGVVLVVVSIERELDVFLLKFIPLGDASGQRPRADSSLLQLKTP
jgi:hypothetical protein